MTGPQGVLPERSADGFAGEACAAQSDGPAARTGPVRESTLGLDRWRLRLSGPGDLVADVLDVLAPPCAVNAAHIGHEGYGWTVRAEYDTAGFLPSTRDAAALFDDLPVLTVSSTARLAIRHAADGRQHLVASYRPGSPVAALEVIAAERTTRVVVPAEGPGRRWPRWLAQLFFASRMLGWWRLLHASAVAVNGRAVLFVAASGGGKSTLAHRACAELGAVFMGDDLTMIGPGGLVAGWPTRAAVPLALARTGDGRPLRQGTRARRVYTAEEHRRTVSYAPPAPIGLVVHVVSGCDGGRPVVGAALPRADLATVAEHALASPAQQLYSTDLLGLTGGPPHIRMAWPDDDWARRLADAAGVRLSVADLPALAHLPVWPVLEPWLAWSRS
ncbi:hypothetical protein SAMN05421505_1606 [Sinosporangium album]|uniref:HprK-related kinase B n=1 Tax=Sinosporangium album TaxID=504805 RepID=A0A1G8L2D5_9ACTN|nr:hypothetical protein [Sinosporangium album]SDI49825.1 hypothetical protein SAMN05421505_1606 [Sinosporangium album]